MSGRLPPLTGRDMVRALEKAGFITVRISGSHHRLIHPVDASRAATRTWVEGAETRHVAIHSSSSPHHSRRTS